MSNSVLIIHTWMEVRGFNYRKAILVNSVSFKGIRILNNNTNKLLLNKINRIKFLYYDIMGRLYTNIIL